MSTNKAEKGIKTITFDDLEIVKDKEIKYKKLEALRFLEEGYKAREIDFEFEGNYISDSFKKQLDYEATDTTVINIGVGNGKTTVAYDLMKEYASKGHVVISASPFRELTKKDFKKLTSDKEYSIVRYDGLITDFIVYQASKNIHVMTINCLLGNPGGDDNSIGEQSKNKGKYLNEIEAYCKKNNKQVVLFFDEIHSGVKNFNFHLLNNIYRRWRHLTKKVFILSATYTEASILVIKYISELTNQHITIYNCQRKKSPDQAQLHLCVCKETYNAKKLGQLIHMKEVIEESLSKKDKVNILVGTKSLAEALCNPESEEPLAKYISSLNYNLLTGDRSEDATFSPDKINIGTTFTTGISIDDENSVFIIVLPVLLGNDSQRMSSIFMEGEPAIIQALARLRKKGKIFVYMYKQLSLIQGDYIDKYFKGNYTPKSIDKLLSYEHQSQIITLGHKAKNAPIVALHEYGFMSNESSYSISKEEYLLNYSQYYLSSSHSAYGKNIAPYIIWGAFNNQFVNCTLSSLTFLEYETVKVNLTGKDLTTEIGSLIRTDIEGIIKPMSDKKAIEELLKDIRIYKPTEEEKKEAGIFDLTPEKKNDIYLKGKLIPSEQLKYVPVIMQTLLTKLYNIRYNNQEDFDTPIYVLSNIEQANDTITSKKELKTNNLKGAYKMLGKVRTLFLEKLSHLKEGDELTDNVIDDTLENMLCFSLAVLKDYDHHIKYKHFSLFQTLLYGSNSDKTIYFLGKDKNPIVRRAKIMKSMLDLFVNYENKRTNKKRMKVFRSFKELPKEQLNLVFEKEII